MFSTKEGRVESIETVPATENDPIKQPYYITNSHTAMNENKVQELQDVVIRFSGDSGDGMQLTGTLFSDTSALLGNGISTFPDYPAEIRAPQGTVAGVSGFQVHFGAKRQLNPGDFCEPCGTEGEPQMAQAGCNGKPRRGLHYRRAPSESGFRNARPDPGAEPGRFQRSRSEHYGDDQGGFGGFRSGQQSDGQVQKHVRTGYLLLPLQPSRGSCETLPRFKICEEKSGYSRSQQTRYRRRLQLCRQHASVRQYIYRRIGPDGERHLPVDQR